MEEIIGYEIELEDRGQDFLKFTTNEKCIVIKTEPFQGIAWNGAYIPVEAQLVGESCMIHNPPYINYGFLKYKVEKITTLKNK